MRRTAMVLALAFACAAAAAAGCASRSPPPAAPPPTTDSAPTRAAHTVSAVVLVNGCAHFGAENARLAVLAMNQLVDGCGSFSGARVQFTATLLPGGAIQFEPRGSGAPAIPICVLNHPLLHSVHLTKACSLDVELEEGSMDVPKPRE
jgi:hypothetical protein